MHELDCKNCDTGQFNYLGSIITQDGWNKSNIIKDNPKLNELLPDEKFAFNKYWICSEVDSWGETWIRKANGQRCDATRRLLE